MHSRIPMHWDASPRNIRALRKKQEPAKIMDAHAEIPCDQCKLHHPLVFRNEDKMSLLSSSFFNNFRGGVPPPTIVPVDCKRQWNSDWSGPAAFHSLPPSFPQSFESWGEAHSAIFDAASPAPLDRCRTGLGLWDGPIFRACIALLNPTTKFLLLAFTFTTLTTVERQLWRLKFDLHLRYEIINFTCSSFPGLFLRHMMVTAFSSLSPSIFRPFWVGFPDNHYLLRSL